MAGSSMPALVVVLVSVSVFVSVLVLVFVCLVMRQSLAAEQTAQDG